MSVPVASAPRPTTTAVTSVVGFLVVLEFASGVLQGWLPPLLPSIVQQYGVTAADANWVNGVYLLSTAVCLPLLAKLGDVYGHRRMLVVAATLVTLGAVLVAVAPTFGVLLLGRALQGPLMAFLPLEFAILRERAQERAGRAIGLLLGALAVGGSLAFLLAGQLREHVSLAATLWVPVVVLAATVPVAALLVPETTVRTPGRVDWVGAALLGGGLALLLAGVGNGGSWGWGDARTVGAVVGGALLLGAWVAAERRVEHPLVDLGMVVQGGLGLPILAGLFLGAELFGSQSAGVLFLGLPKGAAVGLGLTSGQLGFVLLAFGVAASVGAVAAARLVERFGVRVVLAGGALCTAAGYLLTAAAHAAVGPFVVWQVLVGFGNGLTLAVLSALVVARARADAVGISSGLLNISRTVGGAVSASVFVAVMSALVVRPAGSARPVTTEAGYVAVWLVCAALAVAVAGTALLMGRRVAGHEPLTTPAAA
jgi:MFS family permease